MRAHPSMRVAGVCILVALACSQPDTRAPDSASGDSASTVVPARPDTSLQAATAPGSCLVTDSSVGPVRLRTTLDEVRQAMPNATFTRGYDGDGVASVDIVLGADSLMSVVADGDDAETIDWSKPIVFIQTFNPKCSTADGVHPGARVLDVEKTLGKPTKIMMSEIESRQFIEFERQPEGITFRLDYTGIFPEGSRETLRFAPEGKIFSISIARY